MLNKKQPTPWSHWGLVAFCAVAGGIVTWQAPTLAAIVAVLAVCETVNYLNNLSSASS